MKSKEILMEEAPLIGAFWILPNLEINGSTCHYDDPICSITLPFLGGFSSYNKEHKNIWVHYNDGFENVEWNYLPRGRVAYHPEDHIHLIQIGEEFEKNNQIISNIRNFYKIKKFELDEQSQRYYNDPQSIKDGLFG
jgi:hypothetical protein